MNLEDLPDATTLWWRVALACAIDTAAGRETWALDPGHRVLRYDGSDGVRLRLQRLYADRLVLWGTTPGADPRSRWTGIPGWATSDAVHEWLLGRGASFVAWHARDGWDTATPDADYETALRPVTALQPLDSDNRDDPARIAELTAPHDPAPALAVLAAAHDEVPPVQGVVRRLLTGEIRAQMLATRDRDRILPQRPAMLVRWSRIANLSEGFAFAVHLDGGRVMPALGNSGLPERFRTTLLTLLTQLHLEEADDASGGWLFARVRYDAGHLHFDRAFDGRPPWYEDDGPDLDTLALEMSRRDPVWRPRWASLLPSR